MEESMIILNPFEHRTIGDCPDGSLIRFKVRSSAAIALKFAPDSRGRPLVIFLKHAEIGVPSYFAQDAAIPCLRYPDGWLIETCPTEVTYPGKRSFRETPGVIHLQAKSALLHVCLLGEEPGYHDMDVDLLSGISVAVDGDAAPVLHWRIWRNAEEMQRPSAEPLVEFEHHPGPTGTL
jgi:hypothetical protein